MELESLDNLKKAVMEYDREEAASCARKVLEENIDPIAAMDAMTDVIRQIGDLFGKGELFLPELVGAAEAMQAATPILEEELKRKGTKREALGTVVIGTVFGDIHTIGKAMVSTLLVADGFDVHDLGINIKAEEFVKAKTMGGDIELIQDIREHVKFASFKTKEIDPFDLAYAFGVRQVLDQLCSPPRCVDRESAE